ncbi:class I SAM-dependent methyltransferase [Natrialba sp. SSL1]|uniref:class I SAM-dependent methyltransferase n=1 Tax=Natrialba sp. SSL1 TaxID=1869245 RepID=UPI0008F8B902|nr:class I SAM-dependent methyltransferase family protein [Natrialba sp. SSL1]OIB55609.1 methyltransferase [Natrialba sp. SSL1]
MSDEPTDGDDAEQTDSREETATAERVTDILQQASADGPLAVIVEKPRAETAIESLRTEGVYDDSRHVQEDSPERVALPVTAPPTDTDVLDIVRQLDPEYRNRDLAALLADRGWSDDALESTPNSWAVVGSVILVTLPADFPADRERELGEALLELHGEAESVLADEGIANEGEAGRMREPQTRLLAGERDTETVHTEHGTRYGLDPTKVMFSPGNQAERVRMGDVCEPDERVFDMFAGIGYFTLPMARAGAQVTATEINPTAFRYLLENAMLNDVGDRVDAYMSDCRDLTSEVAADRIVMGYYGSGSESESGTENGPKPDGDDERATETAQPETRDEAAHTFLADALDALVPGGVLHYHEATPESRLWERPVRRVETTVDDVGRTVTDVERRRVKSHSAGVAHVVLDVTVE